VRALGPEICVENDFMFAISISNFGSSHEQPTGDWAKSFLLFWLFWGDDAPGINHNRKVEQF